MDMKTAINENYDIYSIAETMNHIEAGEFGDDILSSKFKDFVYNLDADKYEALLGLFDADENGNDASEWLERVQNFMNSLSDEEKTRLSRI